MSDMMKRQLTLRVRSGSPHAMRDPVFNWHAGLWMESEDSEAIDRAIESGGIIASVVRDPGQGGVH